MRTPFPNLLIAMCIALGWNTLSCYGQLSDFTIEYVPNCSSPETSGTESGDRDNSKRSDSLVEEFSFTIQDFKIDHQSEINNLNIKIRYTYVMNIRDADYPDFRLLLKDVEEFLRNYPNKVDFWEILNKKLTLMLLKKYPMLLSVTSEIVVSPSRLDPYTRSSIVTRKQKTLRAISHKRG